MFRQAMVNNYGGIKVEFYVRDTTSTNWSAVTLIYEQRVPWKSSTGFPSYTSFYGQYNVDNWASSSYFDWNGTAPDMKVSDFVTGVFKEFNLTCYALNADNTFQMEPLGDFYAGGDEIDITKYVEEDSMVFKRPKLHQEINFEYQKSKSFLNEAYLELNGKDYGSLKEDFPFDGPKYEIKSPFEHLLFQEFTGTDIKVAYSLTKAPDYKPYLPKPVLLYRNADKDITSAPFHFDNGSTSGAINNYVPFGNEYDSNSLKYSINFGQEISVEDLTPIENSLYWVYYRPYLENLFNIKQRIVHVKAHLPQKILNYMTLDDALIIRDKKYRINQAKLDLTGTLVDLELFQDFVSNPVNYSTGGGDTTTDPTFESLDSGAGTLEVPIKPSKQFSPAGKTGDSSVVVSAVNETPPFLTSSDFGTTITTEKVMNITVAANTTGDRRCNTFSLTYKRADGTTIRTDYYQYCQASDGDRLLTESSEFILTELLEPLAEE